MKNDKLVGTGYTMKKRASENDLLSSFMSLLPFYTVINIIGVCYRVEIALV